MHSKSNLVVFWSRDSPKLSNPREITFLLLLAAPEIAGFKGHLLDKDGDGYIYTCANDTHSINVGSSNITCPVARFNESKNTWSTFDATCVKGNILTMLSYLTVAI